MSLLQQLQDALSDLRKPFAGMLEPREGAFPTMPFYREEEEAWTDDDWERDFVAREEHYKHRDDDRV